MLLEELLGPRVRTKSGSSSASLSPKEKLIKDIDDQLDLISGNNPPMKYLKKKGKICKNKDGSPKMRKIKSWFSDENQFKPTPSGITFFQGENNCFNIGENSKIDILNNFKIEVLNGSYDLEINEWHELCKRRNEVITKYRNDYNGEYSK